MVKNYFRLILIPTKYIKTMSLKSVEPFWRSVTTNTVTQHFYVLIIFFKIEVCLMITNYFYCSIIYTYLMILLYF